MAPQNKGQIRIHVFAYGNTFIQEMKEDLDISKPSASQMMKAFREQCQGFLDDFPVEAGGPGVQVKIMELRV